MGVKAGDVLYYMLHVSELRSIIQWKTWHNPVHERNESKEPESVKRCFQLLELTSRSFSAVIQELHPELLVAVTVFYLVLRGLDTIEDDMTISLKDKEPLLRTFDSNLDKKGWNFDGSGPDEKDRELLVDFHVVIEEFQKQKPAYRKIIADIAKKMGNGMADYAMNAEHNANGVNTVEEYDLYCYYVAGLVGQGVTYLFVEAKLGNPLLLERSNLHRSMGLFLQKINIIRDIREDFEDKRRFWPKEIWSKHVDNFEDLFKPEYRENALNCSSEMVLNALEHVEECMFYLAGLREQSVFNFAAIPQTMAIATLELCFRNYGIFQGNVKISKGQACQIMIDSTQNLQLVCEVFRKFTHKIIKKNKPKDPNFLQISMVCSKIEQFIDGFFPKKDPKTGEKQVAKKDESPEAKAAAEEAKWDLIYMFAAVFSVLLVVSLTMIGIAWYLGVRFDVAANAAKQGKLSRPDPSEAQKLIHQYDHGEL